MSVFFQPGQELDENGLRVYITDSNGNEYPDLEVWYSIFQVDYCCWIAIPDQQMVPATQGTGTGHWYAAWTIPYGQPTDRYQIRWTFRIAATEPLMQRRMPFNIVKIPVGTSRTAECTDLPGKIVVVL